MSKSPSRQREPGRLYRVFISHATADKWIARVICERIEFVGATTFRDDRDIAGGDDIPDAIGDALDGSDELLVLLTPASMNRPWVWVEFGAAWGKRIPTIVVRQHVETVPIPAMLQSRKVLDLNDLDQYLDELGKRMRTRR